MPERIRAALYARVSTEEQALEGYSIDAQLQRMRDYCEAYDYEIVGEYVDEGFSGRNLRRKAYQLMFSPEERKRWDSVIVMKMDRIHRNSKNFLLMMDDLNRHHQNFISTYDRIDTSTAMGRFMMNMLQNLAQLESEQIGERTYMGMREKAESGKGILGFNPPFGYGLEDSELFPIHDELYIVSEIFTSYLNGDTVDMIAYRLNNSDRLTRKGNLWNKYNLRTVLHNPVYAGYIRWDGTLQGHDADTAVSAEDFNRVQMMMASSTRGPKRTDPQLVPENSS